MKRICLNKKYIAKLASKWTSIIFAILGFIGTFVSLSNLLPEDSSMQHRIFIGIGIMVGLWLILFVAFSGYVFWKRRIELFEASNGTMYMYSIGMFLVQMKRQPLKGKRKVENI